MGDGPEQDDRRPRDARLEAGPMAGALTPPTAPDILFAAVEKTRMPMILTDPRQPDNPIIFANRAFQQLSGYDAEQLVGRNCRFLQGPATDQAAVARVREAVAARRDVTVDILNYRRDGTSFVNELYISPVFDRGGDLLYFFGSQGDLTRYADDRRRLRQSEERYRALFEQVEAGFCILQMKYDGTGRTVDYHFLEVNPAFETQTGLKDAEGRWARDLIPDLEECWFETYGAVARDRRSIRFESHAEALNRTFEVHAYPVGDPDQHRVAALFTDVSARKRAEGELKVLTETLEEKVAQRTRDLMVAEEALRHSQKMEAIGQLTGGVAHDFNNLLTIIRSAAEFLQRDDLTAERRRRYVSAIVDTSERAARLTSQLLAFARRQPLKAELFEVGARIQAVGELIQPLVGAGIELRISGCSTACFVEADPAQFETALVNLAVNARDAMEGVGTLRMAARLAGAIPPLRRHVVRPGMFVAIEVEDSGSGIPAGDLERIFEPFFTTKEMGKGTGLGLSQVFGFTKQSGGDIAVESSPAGSLFTLYLPARTEVSAPVPDTAGGSAALPPGACILVVEDNEEVGRFSTELLHDLGFKTQWVADAAAALSRLKDGAGGFDLVFSDVLMPGMNGVELGQEVRRRFPALPVLLASGYSDVLADQGTHGFDLVRKPYSLESLSDSLARAFAGRAAGQT